MGVHRYANFWNLGKTPVEDRKMQGLQNERGKVKKRSKDIIIIARGFYDDLYSERETDKTCQSELLNRIPRGNFEKTTGPVSREEVEAVIHHWKRGGVPGMGEIPYDFFKARFWLNRGNKGGHDYTHTTVNLQCLV